MKKLTALILTVIMVFSLCLICASAADGKKLPAGYERLEYIESNGKQYINTPFVVSPDLRLDVDFQVVDPTLAGTGTGAGIAGAYLTGGTKGGRFQIAYSRTGEYITMGIGNLMVNSPSIIPKDTERHTASLNAYEGKLVFDGKTVGEMAVSELNFTVTEEKNVTITIGVSNLSSKPAAITKYAAGASKIYSVQLYMKNVLVADYVPAKAADGTVGMYDTVSNTFLSNSLEGGENFIAGPTVSAEPVETADTAVYYIAAVALVAVLGTAFFAKRREQ